MNRFQSGEVMVIMMVVMLTIVLMGRGHMGMWHGLGHAAQTPHSASETTPAQVQAASAVPAAQ